MAALSTAALLVTLLAVATTGVAAQAPTAQPPLDGADANTSIEALTGWWRYDGNEWGCDDEDGQYRAALGRYRLEDGILTPDIYQPLQFANYGGRCELVDPIYRDGKVEMVAICTAEEGAFNGRATIETQGQTSINISSPIMNTTLVACHPEQGVGVAMLPLPAFSGDVPNTEPERVAVNRQAPEQQGAFDLMLQNRLPTPDTGSPETSAQRFDTATIDPQRNAVAKVIADYCQPGFHINNSWGDGQWDDELYRQYERQLLVRYGSNCDLFEVQQFAAFTIVDQMLDAAPGLLSNSGPALTATQGGVLGYTLKMQETARLHGCTFFGDDQQSSPKLSDILQSMAEGSTPADLWHIAVGYRMALEVDTAVARVATDSAAICRAQGMHEGPLQLMLHESGILAQFIQNNAQGAQP